MHSKLHSLATSVCLQTAKTATPNNVAFVHSEYRLVAKKGEGTFSEVLKAQCIKNSKYVAIKCMKNHFDSLEQVSVATLRDSYTLSSSC